MSGSAGDRAPAGGGRLRVALTGASGLVGSALTPLLHAAGHEVLRLVRRPPVGPDELFWDPARGQLELARLEGLDAVVHLAGENLARGRWTAARKARIRHSRLAGTRLLVESLLRLARPPRVLVSASAVGYYGDAGPAPLDEHAPAGAGFLPELCRAWEAAAEAACARLRVVTPRFGAVLSPSGGALAKMLPAFRLGLGGPIGAGRQGVSWIAVGDLVDALLRLIVDERLSGPVNLTAPEPVAQRDFARTLGAVLGRPAFLPLPALAVRALFGELGQAFLLDGAFVLPRALTDAGFTFRWPTLDAALRHLLGRP